MLSAVITRSLFAVGLLLALADAAAAQADPAKTEEAADSFSRGQELYQQGKYDEAIKAFRRADELAPHPSAAFNIARCYENLGDPASALRYYRQALQGTDDAATASDIRQRIERLHSLPVKVFVNSRPGGAQITVGGRAAPEPGRTPLVLRLKPGEYALLAEKQGYALAARRVVLQVGQQQPVEIELAPRPRADCPPPRPCPPPECPDLVDAEALHLHVGLLGAIGLALGRPPLAAPGVRGYASYRRLLFGAHALFFPAGEESLAAIDVNGQLYDAAKFSWVLVQFEGGWVIPWRSAALSLSGGLGVSLDRVVFRGAQTTVDLVREETAFAWSLGAALDGMITRWLSVGAGLRVGVIHGDRVAKDNPAGKDDQHHFPYGAFWGTLAVHL